MKKLTPRQMFELVNFLTDCQQYYDDAYIVKAVNNSLKILGYNNEFHYDYENDCFICDGGIENNDN